MSKDNLIYASVDDFELTPGRIYRDHDLDFERINYCLRILRSNIQDISLQIQELKELIQVKKNGE
ncbi:hypothetical protein UFOVP51_41 [uncultured Caudovirales phage]|uniref:Uncharacterized protein n=1 Tax=uncultured Caudovirales phage TaxID=2100421 RepID=A0A6J5KSK8_9CAUD|nr:hypothetical protein UFOVP51_41 [uncultured Caudovirales phage]CAB4241042.1 hypothetical protein UFOVP34_65 [uncultured Caudovirales phage]